ncbi:MAG TPA: 5-oxoprolinase subunit PxpA [Jatrophihabitans sp.]|nr:5-oxoprolinase subunit PxpA [Jatrophihabitans sp.]
MPVRIDLNADLGEGFGAWAGGDDEGLLGVITSANVACGFHAGDPSIMRRVCEQAVERSVAIGAQVGYRDLAGFGRRRIEIDPDELTAEVLYQLGALDAFARAAGDRVRYLKPHGALYHSAVQDAGQAGAILTAVRLWPEPLPVLTLPGSRLAQLAAAAGLPWVAEAFADRAYRADGSLQPRTEAAAVLTDPDQIAPRARALVDGGCIDTVTGEQIRIEARSVCVHGDTPGALRIARAVREALLAAGAELARFA